MSSCLISDVVCTPWEMASFDRTPHAPKPTDYPEVSLPTIEQVSAIQEQARQEGYLAGRAEGYAAGMEQATLEAARLHGIADAFAGELRGADEAISRQVLDLALDFAHAILKTALAVQPELILPIVKEAVRYLPGVQNAALLYLHPEDTALVQSVMGEHLEKLGWLLADDSALERGSCRVETANNQIDAALSTRWHRLAAALGKDSGWLDA